jgi:hypothetical protein
MPAEWRASEPLRPISYDSAMKILLSSSLLVLACLLSSGTASVAVAAEVTGLYQASVPAESRDNERQRIRAFAAGMQDALVRLTGHNDVASEASVQAALASPQSYVESWAYRTLTSTDGTAPQLMIDISFYQAEIQRLLDNAGIPVWPSSRPETLLWLIVQDELGQRVTADLNAVTGAEAMQALQAAALKQGLPVLGPLWDFEDLTVMRPELLWTLDEPTLRLASARYRYDSILAVRILESVTGQVVAKAVHLFRDRVQQVEAFDSDLDSFFADTTAMVARELADNYAVRLTSTAAGSTQAEKLMLLSVDGVNGLADYADLLHYLEGVAGVSDLQVREVDGGQLLFSLNAAGQVRQLVENLALGRKLQAVADPAMGSDGHFRLQYRWQRL